MVIAVSYSREASMRPSPPSKVNQLRIRHLRLIDALASAGSVHKAARGLHLSQPAASTMLKEVEDALGATLFDRTRKGALPNVLGGTAITRMRSALGELDMLWQDLQAARPQPVLRLGSSPSMFHHRVLQGVLPEFVAQTDCRLVFSVETTANLLDLLQAGQLDCLVSRVPVTSVDALMKGGFLFEPLFEVDTCVLVNPAHPLARKRKVTIQDLAAFPWVLAREGTNSRYALLAAFAAAGLPPPNVRIETSSFMYSVQLEPAGDLLMIVYREAGLRQQHLGLGRILPVKLPNLMSPVAFIASRSAMTNPNVRILQEAIQRSLKKSLATRRAAAH